MEFRKCTSFSDAPPASMGTVNFLNKGHTEAQIDDEEPADYDSSTEVDVDLQEIYFLIMHFLSAGPCQKTFRQLSSELLQHKLLPRRHHAWYSRTGAIFGPDSDDDDDGTSFPLNYDTLVGRYPHIKKNHLVKLLKQMMLITSPPSRCTMGSKAPTAADVPTLLGTGSFSLLSSGKNKVSKQAGGVPSYLRWPHMQADQVRGLRLREVGGGFPRHHCAPSIRLACYAIAKPSVMVPKMQNKKKLRGHRDAVYCAIFDRTGRYVITGSDDRLVKIWSTQTAFCLASCRGHEGDVTDLSVSSNNAVVASASNDYSIRVWRVPDGFPISVLRGHTGAVTAIAFCPRPNAFFQLLSSSDDGTCRVWESRSSTCRPRVYLPKPTDASAAKSDGFPSASGSSSANVQRHQILCCAYNVDGTVFVTGSSDTFARVWNACKPTNDDPEQPSHEIDILAGHENDVNYVQFSGCAVSSRSSPSDFSVEDSSPKFKTSWYSHDNIVTCSRDGSAIIWIPRSRRSHGKVRRWVRAYHLKVPPPPMPPQPPRGGPRQRLLPTPRGVNMIVWSLDNRFVLAAIMDNRICVWNANDGSLVHSLAGHTAYTYVLDVHPFNPRIAMSAGYDGKTILWDIWEGTQIWVYDIDVRFKLVDGKFSQDGTSIVLSDDVGQIYLLNTGEGESQKDAKYDQFFLGDYRPLIQDAQGNVVDQETQLVPYQRNMKDALCDSSMLPYPEPYQSMYQTRRLGVFGIEWDASSIKFAVGTDIGLGQEFQILPLADLDTAIEPLPDYLDALYWEPEYDIMNDDNDSEYNVTEEYVSDEPMCATDRATSDSDCSEEGKIGKNKKESSRRSKRKKPLQEVISSSGRLVKRRSSDEDGTSTRTKRSKRSKARRQGNSRRKYPQSKSLRPQRVAARNAVNSFCQAAEASTSADEEDVYISAGDTDSESSFEHTEDLLNEKMKYTGVTEVFSDGSDATAVRLPEHADLPIYSENRKKLVLKFSLNRKNPSTTESQMTPLKRQASANTSFAAIKEDPEDERVELRPYNPESSSTTIVNKELPETYLMRSIDAEKPTEADNDLGPSTSCSVATASWGKFKIRTSGTQSGNLLPRNVNSFRTDECLWDDDKQRFDRYSGQSNELNFGVGEWGSSCFHGGGSGKVDFNEETLNEPYNSSYKKPMIIKIKSKKHPVDSPDPPDETRSSSSSGAAGQNHFLVEEKPLPEIPVTNIDYEEQFHVNGDDSNRGNVFNTHKAVAQMPDIEADVARRSRSFKLKANSREINLPSSSFEMGMDYLQPGTSRSPEKFRKKDTDHLSDVKQMSTSKHTISRSSRNKTEGYSSGHRSGFAERNIQDIPKKVHWLLLLHQEAYRYIPQLGDKVVYLRQGHQGHIELSGKPQNFPWMRDRDKIRAAEDCLVDDLKYTTVSGSGLSGCEITLRFIDTSCNLKGKTFIVTLPELNDFPDFIVEKTRYDAAMERNWKARDKCQVWWRDDSAEGGAWWDGCIFDIKDRTSDFPGSPWESCVVRYMDDPVEHFHCPWELHDPESLWQQPKIDYNTSRKFASAIANLLEKAIKNKDRYGIQKLNVVAEKSDFVNRFPVPITPKIIQERLKNDYYRSIKATRHDIRVMLSNAESYFKFQRNSELLRKTERLSEWFDRELLNL